MAGPAVTIAGPGIDPVPVPRAEPVGAARSARRSRRASRLGRSTRVMRLPLTSMIDIIFQLLIYFVITSSFVSNEGVLSTRLPAGTGVAPPTLEASPRPIRITLDPAPDRSGPVLAVVGLGQAVPDASALRRTLIALQYDPDAGRRGPFPVDSPVVIAPAPGVRWQHVVDAFNAATAAGYQRIRFENTAP